MTGTSEIADVAGCSACDRSDAVLAVAIEHRLDADESRAERVRRDE